MSESIASLRHQIDSAEELKSVVRSMKAMASSSIGQYENAVRSLDDYYRTVQLGLAACFRQGSPVVSGPKRQPKDKASIGVVVFGSDQGLVGQFNDVMVDFVVDALKQLPCEKRVWAVGERLQSRLKEANLVLQDDFLLPKSINAITSLVGQILTEIEAQREQGIIGQVYLFHHRPKSGAISTPVSQVLLPLDELWQENMLSIKWPTNNVPEVMPKPDQTLRALIREYLFASIFRACAESLASENASRLAAMQRAEKNIEDLQKDLNLTFQRLRQSSIDEELFDVISGFEALIE
jgi:F-type H+-transporting ATPase subunit gamma